MHFMDVEHIEMMRSAIDEAEKARQKGEVPVGAILVDENNQVLAAAHNQTIALKDPTAHAEILAIRSGAVRIDNYRLLNTTLYVTVEPCPMCMGAAIHARVAQVVFGTRDPKWGAVGSLYDFTNDLRFNHQPKVIAGICEAECRALMQNFFREKRSS